MFQSLERQNQMRPTLGWHQRMNLVEDHRIDTSQNLPGVRGQQQIKRLGGRHQDVGRVPEKARSLRRRRVAGANRDGGRVVLNIQFARGLRNAHERRLQVAFNVDGERLYRGDV